MSNTENKPPIRFRGFPEPWTKYKFADFATLTNGRAYSQRELLQRGKYRVLRVGNFYTNDAWYFSDLELGDKYYAENGDLLYTWSATFGPHIWLGDRVIYHYHIWKVELKEFMEKQFVIQLLEKDKQNILSTHNGSTMIHITKFDMEQKAMIVSSFAEQAKVGEYLSLFDRLITLRQRKYEKLVALKKAMLEKMFPKTGTNVPEIRFSGFTGAWEQRKWSESVNISTEMVDPKTGEFDELPHVAPGNIESFTGRLLNNVKSVKEENLISGKFHFYPDDIVYGKINPQLGKYVFTSFEGLTSADAYVLNAKDEVNQKFLFSLLHTQEFFNYTVSVSKRSGMPKINRDELNAYGFLAPSKAEQDKIGCLFLEFDDLITLHQRELEKLKNLKQAFLQKLFVQEQGS